MTPPIRFELPADTAALGVVRDVIGTAFAVSDRTAERWEDVATAADEVLMELCSSPGVERIGIAVGPASVEIEATGDEPTWDPSPIAQRLLPRLATISVGIGDGGDGGVRVVLGPVDRA